MHMIDARSIEPGPSRGTASTYLTSLSSMQVRAYHAELSQIMGAPEAARGVAPAALHVR